MSEPTTNPDPIRPAARPHGVHLVRTLVGLVRSVPTGEASPLGQPTQFQLKPWLPYEADLTVTDIPGEPTDTPADSRDDSAGLGHAREREAVEDEDEALRQGLLDGTVSVAESIAARPQWRELALLAGLDPDDDTHTPTTGRDAQDQRDAADQAPGVEARAAEHADQAADEQTAAADAEVDEVGWP